MELRDALTQIAEIRQQVARTELFRGYRALPVAFSGLAAFAAAAAQALWIPEPGRKISANLALCVWATSLSMFATRWALVWRLGRRGRPLGGAPAVVARAAI